MIQSTNRRRPTVEPMMGGAREESEVRPPVVKPGELETKAEPRGHRDQVAM